MNAMPFKNMSIVMHNLQDIESAVHLVLSALKCQL